MLTMSIKEHSRCLTTTATATRNINEGKKRAHTVQTVQQIALFKQNLIMGATDTILKENIVP